MNVQFDLFINFDGDCREAVDFYAGVFKSKVKDLMTYSEIPQGDSFVPVDEDKDKIMYAMIKIGAVNAMFMDMPSGVPLTKGNNITPTITFDDREETYRIFNGLKEGGTVHEELTKTFFSELCGMVEDKFGVFWQILLTESK